MLSFIDVESFRSSSIAMTKMQRFNVLQMSLDPALTKIFPRDFKNIPLGMWFAMVIHAVVASSYLLMYSNAVNVVSVVSDIILLNIS